MPSRFSTSKSPRGAGRWRRWGHSFERHSTPPARSIARRSIRAAGECGVLPAATLPDLVRESLDVLFVGINPSVYAVEHGHYFARPTNRFWPCLSRSVLSRAARAALGVAVLRPEHDRALGAYGIGFTDIVKRATVRASEVAPVELTAGVEALVTKIELYRPRIACFHGVTGYRPVHRALSGQNVDPDLGLQPLSIGATAVYLVPNPSGANAHVTPAAQVVWYDRLAAHLAEITHDSM